MKAWEFLKPSWWKIGVTALLLMALASYQELTKSLIPSDYPQYLIALSFFLVAYVIACIIIAAIKIWPDFFKLEKTKVIIAGILFFIMPGLLFHSRMCLAVGLCPSGWLLTLFPGVEVVLLLISSPWPHRALFGAVSPSILWFSVLTHLFVTYVVACGIVALYRRYVQKGGGEPT